MIFLAAVIFAGNLFAADVATDFSAANKLYAEGKFADAADVLRKILQSGRQSPALLFNYANAEFKSGHLGKAIAAYRRAELLAPRDAEIRANLALRPQPGPGRDVARKPLAGLDRQLTLNEGTLLTAVFFWVMFACCVARQIRPALVPKLRSATRLAVALTIFSGAVLGLQAANHFSGQSAVVTVPEATARSGPFDEAQSVFTARDGAELARFGPA